MPTVIKLSCKALGIEGREFTVDHAERLLQLEERMGKSNWEITPDTGYIYRNGTIERTDKGSDQISEVRSPAE